MTQWPDETIPIPGDDDVIVLTERSVWGSGVGLLARIRPDGSHVWQVQAPNEWKDFFVDAHVEDGEVVAHSWSAYFVRVDLATGEELERTFTK